MCVLGLEQNKCITQQERWENERIVSLYYVYYCKYKNDNNKEIFYCVLLSWAKVSRKIKIRWRKNYMIWSSFSDKLMIVCRWWYVSKQALKGKYEHKEKKSSLNVHEWLVIWWCSSVYCLFMISGIIQIVFCLSFILIYGGFGIEFRNAVRSFCSTFIEKVKVYICCNKIENIMIPVRHVLMYCLLSLLKQLQKFIEICDE